MSDPEIEFGSPAFWDFYDEFCREDELAQLVEGKSRLVSRMREITRQAHQSRAIHLSTFPERGWRNHCAWLALANAPIRDVEGQTLLTMRVGDVVAVAWGWDRDVFLTHSPLHEKVIGYLLSGAWPDMIGLFLPLFSRKTIETCVRLRLQKNTEMAMVSLVQNADVWGWPS